MHVRDRVYGIETEYGCIAKRNNGIVLTPNDFRGEFLQGYIRAYGTNGGGLVLAGDRLWHPNGSLTYIDTGSHPEHATGEARSVRDAVIYYKAGDRLMADIFSPARNNKQAVTYRPCDISAVTYGFVPPLRFQRRPCDISVELYKNNISDGCHDTLVTFGCHENYLIYDYDGAPAAMAQWQALSPFLITRQIIDGAGYWDDTGSFFLSQRAFFMGSRRRASPFTVGVKDAGPMARIHVTTGDANIMEFATFMKVGTLSLVLSLVDARAMPDLVCDHGMSAFYDVARSGINDRVVYLKSGDRMSAHEIQACYCEIIRQQMKTATFASEQTEAESREVLRMWEMSLNALGRSDIAWMLGRIDWATKQWLGRSLNAQESDEATMQKRKDLNVLYHAIGNGPLQERMNSRWSDRRMVTDEEIIHAMTRPPSGTRAASRGDFVRRMQVLGIGKRVPVSIDWNRLETINSPRMHLSMPEPLASYDARIVPFIDRLKTWREHCYQY